MRSTLTIDKTIDDKLRSYARARSLSYKEAVNLALEKGLDRLEVAEAPVPYAVESLHAELLPGIDAGHLNSLADELDER